MRTDYRGMRSGSSGRLSIDECAMTRRTSLSISGEIEIESWLRIGQEIDRINDASTWWLGDWLIYGELHFPDRYKRAIAETTLEYQTLRNYAWVARRFPAARRRGALSLQHHAEVAGLPDEDEQDSWLERAECEGWSKSELRRRVRAGQRGDHPRGVVSLSVNIDPARKRRWEEAASRSNQDLEAWMLVVLDKAAAERIEPEKDLARIRKAS